uniref:Cytochrome P450-1 n=1 Tax=Thanatephorus cucumeris TaxID=107832 RepID=A0A2P0ZW33_THACU|nr:steroid 19-hydroxylase [Thanatephorus cucumeris]QDJ74241.1 cytochrome P450-1 [Thanatephorus cucumeris]
MSNSTLVSFASLRTLLDTVVQPGGGSSSSDVLALAKTHSLELGLGAFAIVATRYMYQLLKRANALKELDGPSPISSIWGDENLLSDFENGLSAHDELLNRYGSVCRIKGPLGEDRLWTADPRAINDIILKGFDHFHEPEGLLAWFDLSFGPTLISQIGHKHKIQRKILNPVFTAAHMRKLTPIFHSITHYLEDVVASKVRASGGKTGIVDMYTWMSNVALEMIGQAGIGHSFGVMEGKEPEYIDASRQLFILICRMWYIRPFLPILMKIGTTRFRQFVIERIPHGPTNEMKKVVDVMDKMATDIYAQKKEALANGTLDSEIAAGNDIISMLLKQNEVVPPEDQMSEEEILAQVNGLIFAGHDTTSGGLTRTLHLLAQHPEVQDQLRAEVREAHGLHGKELDYDQLNSLTYLDAVCRESLRLWSPAQTLERVAMKDWNLPLHYPVKSNDGKKMVTSLNIPEGTHIYISLGSVNRDKQTWGDDADKFNPARWLSPPPASVTESRIPGVYSNMMTFSGGPRSCLGFKFSQLEMKVVLSALVASFKFELGPEQHMWGAAGVLKPHVRHQDGTIDATPSLRMKVTLVEE